MAPPRLDDAELQARLRAFYAKHNPGNDHNIAEIARKFAGREHVLCAKLAKKYGEAPDLVSPTDEEKTPTMGEKEPSKRIEDGLADAYDPSFQAYDTPTSRGGPLDFRAIDFDPLEALRSTRTRPLVATHPLDNIIKCRHLLPESDPSHQKLTGAVVPKKPSPASTPAASTSSETVKAATPAQRTPHAVKFLEDLADTYLDGPFMVLRRCFLERRRVCVVVRRVNSVRGQCTGFLKAFDKHMNVVLVDVHERMIPAAAHIANVAARQRNTDDDPVPPYSVARILHDRHMPPQMEHLYRKQLFIRGDNIVMVLEDQRKM
ncbi:TPA: hypothetical protein N0F65_006085 [Lagenidium giganteum]|uniref:Sm domain-containing protein n=1 Tax=Lagenidium giganteum TaxID=4803 RepID=A0AAV2YQX2_9STRA|nr:TPA: hypothetical protein N0F65_006085 [Lagenidium giganteum]